MFSKDELLNLKKQRKIVFFDNYIIDVTDFIEFHPGGQIHLIETLNHDVSRYLDATAAINPSFDPRSHMVSTYQHIFDTMIIGQIMNNSNLIVNSEIIDEKFNPVSSRKIAKDTNEFRYGLISKNPNIRFSRFLQGYQWVGRHFAVIKILIKVSSVSLNKTRYYSICLCLNEIVYEKHRIILSNIIKLENNEPIVSPYLNEEEIISDSLELYIKKYNFEGGLSKFLHEQNKDSENIIARGPLVLKY